MKKKKYNKLLLIIILICQFMVINVVNAENFTLGTKASTQDPNSRIINNKKTLTISRVEGSDILTSYKILDAFYNTTANTVSYEFTDDFKGYLASTTTYNNLTIEEYTKLTSGNITDGSVMTSSTLDRLVSGYVAYIKTNNITGTDMSMSDTYRTSSLSVGSYLVIPKTSARIYAVMVGNLSVTENNNEWQFNDQTIVAKVSNPGVITKSIVGNKEENSFNIGTEFSYEITGTIPQYPTNAANKKYTITDTMSNGLTFSGLSSVTITDGITNLTVNNNGAILDSSNTTVGTIIVNGQVITFDFNLDNIKSNSITITYKAKLNNQASIGSSGNTNDAKITYANDPYSESVYDSDVSSTKVYTYGIDILKYSGSNKANTLKDASFDIYSDAALTNKVGSLTTGDNGHGLFTGLAAGTYYLKETKAPSGHTLLSNAFSIKVAGDSTSESPTNPGYFCQEISNSRNNMLPFTGGYGTYIFTIIGIVVVVLATVIYIIYRKKKKNRDQIEK